MGNYVQDLTSYAKVLVLYQDYLENTPLNDVEVLWETVNQRRRPIGRAGEYELLEQLGAGAFGCVYTARKITASASGQPKLFAVKEVSFLEISPPVESRQEDAFRLDWRVILEGQD